MSVISRLPRGTAAVLLSAAAVAGCGHASSARPPVRNGLTAAPPFRAADFPDPAGRSAAQLASGLPLGGVVAATQSIFHPGRSRFGFALFDPGHNQLTGAEVALYVGSASATHLRGPYPAAEESLHVAPAFQSQTVASDPGAAQAVDVGQVPLGRAPAQSVFVLARINGRLVAFQPAAIQLARPGSDPPAVGQPAPVIHTPTVASVGGNVSAIDTRRPPDDMHAVDLAGALGHRPVLLLFGTPQLCQSRVCGPVVDIAQELKSRLGGQADFIHMEIYNDNQVAAGFRPQVRAYRLPTEPWAFAIDRRGRIAARIEGAFGLGELTELVKRAIGS